MGISKTNPIKGLETATITSHGCALMLLPRSLLAAHIFWITFIFWIVAMFFDHPTPITKRGRWDITRLLWDLFLKFPLSQLMLSYKMRNVLQESLFVVFSNFRPNFSPQVAQFFCNNPLFKISFLPHCTFLPESLLCCN